MGFKLEVQNKSFLKYLEEKASISVNGVSLTISKVKELFSFKYYSSHFEIN